VSGVSLSSSSLAVRFTGEARGLVEAFAAAEQICCAAIEWKVETGPPVTLRIGAEELVLDAIAMMFPTNQMEKTQQEVPMATQQDIKQEVRKRYGKAAIKAQETSADAGCCGSSIDDSVITSSLYSTDELQHLPNEAVVASLGCGNPVAVADLHEGETVLDLGSGGGIDVLLSARRVGPQGKAYGLDMTEEMLELARGNAAKAGVTNVEFLKGEMEDIPLPDATVDVIISNCVVNLSPDKDAVLKQAFRVLKPGGRIAIADIVTRQDLPAPVRESMAAWTGCIAGALAEDDYRAKLSAAGFEDVLIESFREYTASDAEAGGLGNDLREYANAEGGVGIFSAVVRARKPASTASVKAAGAWEPIKVVAGDASQGACCGSPSSCC
jgi:arsenite methyltransferase